MTGPPAHHEQCCPKNWEDEEAPLRTEVPTSQPSGTGEFDGEELERALAARGETEDGTLEKVPPHVHPHRKPELPRGEEPVEPQKTESNDDRRREDGRIRVRTVDHPIH